MVSGLAIFRSWFRDYADQYILIGGTAATLAMVELFSRAPDGLVPAQGSRLTPIPLDEAVSSLSAILLDDAYYEFILSGRAGGCEEDRQGYEPISDNSGIEYFGRSKITTAR